MEGRSARSRASAALLSSGGIFAIALSAWAITTFQGATADSLGFDQAVKLQTEQLAYSLGQPVTITLYNQDHSPVTLPSAAPFAISQSGEVLYQPFDDATPKQVEAGGRISWTWNQQDALGDPVGAGTYDLAAAYSLEKTDAVVNTTIVIMPTSTLGSGFEVAPNTGTAPLQVTVRCPSQSSPVVLNFGDESDSLLLDRCPSTISHTYASAGSFTLSVRQGSETLGTETITVSAADLVASNDRGGTGALSMRSLRDLLLALIAAAIASGLVSYVIIGRPVVARSAGQ